MSSSGVMVYLNGVEVVRSNMFLGEVRPTSEARTSVRDQDEATFFHHYANAEYLREGENVLAVEVHQIPDVGKPSSDLSFDLEVSLQESPSTFFERRPDLFAGAMKSTKGGALPIVGIFNRCPLGIEFFFQSKIDAGHPKIGALGEEDWVARAKIQAALHNWDAVYDAVAKRTELFDPRLITVKNDAEKLRFRQLCKLVADAPVNYRDPGHLALFENMVRLSSAILGPKDGMTRRLFTEAIAVHRTLGSNEPDEEILAGIVGQRGLILVAARVREALDNNDWNKAAKLQAHYIEKTGSKASSLDHMLSVALCLRIDDREGYEHACNRMLERFSDSQRPNEVDQTVKSLCAADRPKDSPAVKAANVMMDGIFADLALQEARETIRSPAN